MKLVQPPKARSVPHWWSTQPPCSDNPALTTRRAYLEVLLVFGVFFAAGIASAGFAVAGHDPTAVNYGWTDAIPGAIDQVGETVLCILLPLLLVHRRGLKTADLGIDRHQPSIPASQNVRIAAWALLGLLGGSVLTAALATGKYPVGHFSYPNLILNLFHGAQAGFIEEIVVLAFVVTTLEQAHRPPTEIIAVALILRMSYHIYYGPGVVGVLVWASVFLWLFLRFRTIIPLIVVHSTWDVLAFLGQHWKAVAGLEGLAWISLFLTAFILWLSYRSERNRPRPLAIPGWYRDPYRPDSLRWFNGWQWSPSTRALPESPQETVID